MKANWQNTELQTADFCDEYHMHFPLTLTLSPEGRGKGEGDLRPIQYILGGTGFCGLWFSVTKDTLIPRPETEELVGLIVKRYKDRNVRPQLLVENCHCEEGVKRLTKQSSTGLLRCYAPRNDSSPFVTEALHRNVRIIDLGTGSGNIAVSLAVSLNAFIYAVDINKEALIIAEQNAKRYKVEDKIRFIQNNWLDGLDIDPVDIIVSNPPYISAEEWDSLDANVSDYEPRIALYGGNKGLDCYKKILSNIERYLKPNGEIYFEIGYNQGSLVKDILSEKGCFTKLEVIKDKGGRDRILRALM